MGTITSIEPQAHDPDRVSIFVDGRFAVGTTRYQVVSARLSVGQELSEHELAALAEVDAVERAFNAALNFLSYRPRSRHELERYFQQRGVHADVAAAAIERLERTQLVDDSAFASFWVQNRQQFSPRGRRALRSELRSKGIADEVIDEALAPLDDEETAAYEAARRRAQRFSTLDQPEFMRKVTALLQRRGFSYSDAAAAASRLWEERDAE